MACIGTSSSSSSASSLDLTPVYALPLIEPAAFDVVFEIKVLESASVPVPSGSINAAILPDSIELAHKRLASAADAENGL